MRLCAYSLIKGDRSHLGWQDGLLRKVQDAAAARALRPHRANALDSAELSCLTDWAWLETPKASPHPRLRRPHRPQ